MALHVRYVLGTFLKQSSAKQQREMKKQNKNKKEQREMTKIIMCILENVNRNSEYLIFILELNTELSTVFTYSVHSSDTDRQTERFSQSRDS